MAMRDFENSPQIYARIAGAIYLAVIVFGMFSEGVAMNSLVASGDVAATVRNIKAQPDLWRFTVAGDLIIPVIALVQLWIEYLLLRAAGRLGALLFLFFNGASLAVEAVSKVFLLLVAPAIAGQGYAKALEARQLHALVGFALAAHSVSFNVALVFFGAALLIAGHLIARSTFLPGLLGRLVQLAGLCYLIACFAALFAPAVLDIISPWILLPSLVGEGGLCLWLLIRGVDAARWREKNAEQGA